MADWAAATALTSWLGQVPAPLLLVSVAALLTVESGALLGFLVPGSSLLLATGATAQATGAPFWLVLAVCAAAVVTGGQLGFANGFRARQRRDSDAPGTAGWARAQQLVRRHGWWAVVLTQWVFGVRTLAPFAAGWSRLSRRAFTAAHVPAATLWAAALTAFGYQGAHYTGWDIGPLVLASAGLATAASLVRWGLSLRRARGRSEVPGSPGNRARPAASYQVT